MWPFAGTETPDPSGAAAAPGAADKTPPPPPSDDEKSPLYLTRSQQKRAERNELAAAAGPGSENEHRPNPPSMGGPPAPPLETVEGSPLDSPEQPAVEDGKPAAKLDESPASGSGGSVYYDTDQEEEGPMYPHSIAISSRAVASATAVGTAPSPSDASLSGSKRSATTMTTTGDDRFAAVLGPIMEKLRTMQGLINDGNRALSNQIEEGNRGLADHLNGMEERNAERHEAARAQDAERHTQIAEGFRATISAASKFETPQKPPKKMQRTSSSAGRSATTEPETPIGHRGSDVTITDFIVEYLAENPSAGAEEVKAAWNAYKAEEGEEGEFWFGASILFAFCHPQD